MKIAREQKFERQKKTLEKVRAKESGDGIECRIARARRQHAAVKR